MNRRNDMEYYRSRALREREIARKSTNASIARIHLEMAERYEQMIETGQVATTSAASVAINR